MSTKTSSHGTAPPPIQLPGDVKESSSHFNEIQIKKELPSDEIKEFAENTMNELLGWYGFDGVERSDMSEPTTTTNTTVISTTTSTAAPHLLRATSSVQTTTKPNANCTAHEHATIAFHLINTNSSHSSVEKTRSSRSGRAMSQLHYQQQLEQMLKLNNNNPITKNHNKAIMCATDVRSSKSGKHSLNNGRLIKEKSYTAYTGNDSTASDHDSRSSHEDDGRCPQMLPNLTVTDRTENENCCWCRRLVPNNAPEFLTTSDGPRYCSESCFAQSRRASFKKAKTCDWCKHVRHAVSYVDFQDGASQLQFCSDKCLNQYKMQIFCKETQAHLDMNPHLCDQNLEAAAGGNDSGLITPDLWMRNCRSRSASPSSTVSISPGPSSSARTMPHTVTPPNVTFNCAAKSTTTMTTALSKPLISVAPASKLMSKTNSIISHRCGSKHTRKKRSNHSPAISTEAALPISKNTHQQVGMPRELGTGLFTKLKMPLIAAGPANSNGGGNTAVRKSPSPSSLNGATTKANTSAFGQFTGASVPDIQMGVAPISPMLDSSVQMHGLHAAHEVGLRGNANLPSGFLSRTSASSPHMQIPLSNFFPPRLPFVQTNSVPQIISNGLMPRFSEGSVAGAGGGSNGGVGYARIPAQQHGQLPVNSTFQADIPANPLLASIPPVTVMVPYPIIIPLPIPIPVPLPIIDFVKAHLPAEQRHEQMATSSSFASNESHMSSKSVHQPEKRNEVDEPLDFRKNRAISEESNHDDNNGQNSKTDLRSPSVENQERDRNGNSNSAESTSCCKSDELKTSFHANGILGQCMTNKKDTLNKACILLQRDDHDPDVIGNDEAHTEVDADVDLDDGADDNDVGKIGGEIGMQKESSQKLPRLKITRLQIKRTLLQQQHDTKEVEYSRPLRKRKRIIDCDFQKFSTKGLSGVIENLTTESNQFETTNKTDPSTIISADQPRESVTIEK